MTTPQVVQMGKSDSVFPGIYFGYVNCLQVNILFFSKHATADVSLMLMASKLDIEAKREVPTEDGQKVN